MMRLNSLLTDATVLAELGRRVELNRLQRNWTQDDLADAAQIGRATLQRLERGRPVQTTSLIKVLRALELLGGLDAAVPASVVLPIAELERQRRGERRRATRSRGGSEEQAWRWGDEREADA